MDKSAERVEPEGETKVPEIIIVSDVVERTYVDLERAGRSKKNLEEKEKYQAKRERYTVREGKRFEWNQKKRGD